MNKIIEPSLLSFDLKNIQNELDQMKSIGLTQIHYDVMDNKFVPNTAFKTEWLKLLNDNGFEMSVHFMVMNPKDWVNQFIDFKGIKTITFHLEPISKEETLELLKFIKSRGIKAGVAIRPTTDPNEHIEILKASDLITVMGVQPGFGGQKFMPVVIDNLKKINEIKRQHNPNLIIQIDGGVNFDVLKQTYQYCDWFVSGSFLMKYNGNKKDIVDYFKNLK